MKMDKEEKELLEAYEKSETKSIPQLKSAIKKYSNYAKSSLTKNKRINIRLSEKDLLRIQMKAIQEGLPYQTLISSVLHKYITGLLKDHSK